jgi:hypothetical protein
MDGTMEIYLICKKGRGKNKKIPYAVKIRVRNRFFGIYRIGYS